MERTEVCLICERSEPARGLGLWFVNGHRWPVHADCWIGAYRAGQLPVHGTRLTA
ncbi:MAG TPA: hypothetical protein VF010_00215 [Methylomirabilota bacterium]|jgi:hypothetical protein|nr:hypothetical protein [Methylomirabilota bacterium]